MVARVHTPICEGNTCYAVEIDYYWDCIGRFHHFDTIAGKGLTKLDHIPFTESDYIKLNEILSNPNSILGSYTRDELVKDTRSSSIDGVTGATRTEIKESVIGGAVYSCYTLWHIANGAVTDSLRVRTKRMFNENFVRKLVAREDQEINYYLITSFTESDFARYLPEILETIKDGKGYYAKNAIEKIPANIINDTLSQDFMTHNFRQLDYFAQVALLEKLHAGSLLEGLKISLSREMDERDSYKTGLIKALLSQ